jgi:tetratricopeptide (TPR) repeat protein
MIQRKIDRLSEEERRLLVTASVQGNEFDSAILAKVLKRDPVEVEDQLEVLARVHSFVRSLGEREFPEMTPTLRYTFVHILYQNTFYESLSMTRKTTLSLSLAEVILSYYGEKSQEIASELAFLLEAGRDFARASDYFILAAQSAVEVHAIQEAVSLLKRSIENAEKLEGEERTSRILKASLQKGYLHFSIGTLAGLDKSIIDYTLAEKVAEESKNVEGQVSAICRTAFSYFISRRMQEAIHHGRRALELANSVRSKIGTASAQALLAIERMCVGDLDASEKYFDKAIPVLRDHASPNQIGDAVIMRGILYSWRLDHENQKRFNEWALEQAKKAGSVYQITINQFHMGMAYGNQGLISEALNMLNESLHISELNNIMGMLNCVPNTIGWIFSELQDIKSAHALNKKSIQYSQDLEEAEPEANARINLARDHIIVGELDSAFEHLQVAQQLYDKDIWFRWRYNIRTQAELANYWIARGDLKLATSHASTSLEAAEKTLSRKYIAWAKKILGDIAVLDDRVEDGKKYYGAALNLLNIYPCPTIEWKILKAAADLAKTLKDNSAATEFRGHAKAVVQSLADSVTDEKLRKTFLSSKAIREL